MKLRLLSYILSLATLSVAKAAITTTPAYQPDLYVDCIASDDIVYSNVRTTGRDSCVRKFIRGLESVHGIPEFPDEGLVLSTGKAGAIEEPVNIDEGSCLQEEGDPDLNDMLGGEITADACVLEFDFENNLPGTDAYVFFQYLFASDEYPDDRNDAFAFFLNGNNIALVPRTKTVNVGPDTINKDKNSLYFLDNDPRNYGIYDQPESRFEPNGFTKKLKATGLLQEGTNHMKMVIADTGDCLTDSWVLIEKGSFQVVDTSFAEQSIPVRKSTAGSIKMSLPSYPLQMVKLMAPDLKVWDILQKGRGACANRFMGGGIKAAKREDGFKVPFPEMGVSLSTGDARFEDQDYGASSSTCYGESGDDELDALTGQTTEDACSLEFDFDSPDGSDLVLNFVFASEEYNNNLGADAVGIFLNGDNIALVQETDIDVGTDTVNKETNPDFFWDNDPDAHDPVPFPKLEFDGFTQSIEARGSTQLGDNHIKIVVADTYGCEYDSWILIEAYSIRFADPVVSE